MTTTEAETTTRWTLSGAGYEYCNCKPGCTCNFSGFPSSSDGSCKALVANVIRAGSCGDVDLAGVTAVAIMDWPKAIHDGDGRAVFVVAPETTDEQIGALSQIYTGALVACRGRFWERRSRSRDWSRPPSGSPRPASTPASIEIEGLGSAQGRALEQMPVTDEPHEAHITLPDGFIWTDGQLRGRLVLRDGRGSQPGLHRHQLDPLRLRLGQLTPVAMSGGVAAAWVR